MYSRLWHASFFDEQIVFWEIDQLVQLAFIRLHLVAFFHLFLHHQHPRKMELDIFGVQIILDLFHWCQVSFGKPFIEQSVSHF